LRKFLTALPVRFEVTEGRSQLNAVIIDIEQKTGRAKAIERIMINDDHPYFE
jgi:calcineurin-like phosphoesterase